MTQILPKFHKYLLEIYQYPYTFLVFVFFLKKTELQSLEQKGKKKEIKMDEISRLHRIWI